MARNNRTKVYTVKLTRDVRHHATVVIRALDEESARRVAPQCADDNPSHNERAAATRAWHLMSAGTPP